MRYITDVDNHGNLKAIVTQDLKELGIKIPKVKKNKSKEESLNANNDAVFGNYLSLVPSIFLDDYGPVAKFLVDATQLLEKHITVEGLFRKSGSVARQKELRVRYEVGEDLNDANPLDVASLIKQFFRELPDPLLTTRYHEAFFKCYALDAEDMRAFAILHLCHMLPMHHISTLRFFMSFLQAVAANSDCNKMDVANLAVCLAPNLMYMTGKGEKADSRLIQTQTNIIQLLISTAGEIGTVSDSLFERTCLLSACYPSEDELERSDIGNTNHDDSKSKKKKRRSGSLQGMINNLSSSFSKWRKDGGSAGKGHNSSNLSDRSTLSTMSYVSFNDRSSIFTCPPIPGLDQQDGMIGLTPEAEAEGLCSEATPKVMRKRKAEDEAVPFSASKRKAILQNMPQMSALGGTPFTPQVRKGARPADFQDTPSIKFSNNSDVIFNATPRMQNTPRRKVDKLFSPTSATKVKRSSSGKSGCFTPKTPKSGVRRSVRGFLRRLSGGKDPQPSTSNGEVALDDVGQKLSFDDVVSGHDSISKKKSFFKRHKKTPSSPARLVTQLYNETKRQEGLNESYTSNELGAEGPMLSGRDTSISSAHRRSLSAGGVALKRGKPNTVKTGLPSPNKRRSMDTSSLKQGHSPEKTDNPSALDTSPILKTDHCSPQSIVNMEASPHCMSRHTSKSSIISENMEGCGEADFDRAFIHESMLVVDNEDTEVDVDAPFRKPEAPSVALSSCHSESSVVNTDTNVMTVVGKSKSDSHINRSGCEASEESTKSSKSSLHRQQQSVESIDSAVDSEMSKSESIQSLKSEDSGLGHNYEGEETSGFSRNGRDSFRSLKEGAVPIPIKRQEATCANHGPNLQISTDMHHMLSKAGVMGGSQTKKPAPLIALPIPNQEGIGANESDESEVVESVREITDRRAEPLRFANSTTRKRRMSPIRIPTIFAKADQEMMKYQEITKNITKPSSPPVKVGSAKKPILPISTNLVRSAAVESAKARLNMETEGKMQERLAIKVLKKAAAGEISTPEGHRIQDDAGHTPKRTNLTESSLHTVEMDSVDSSEPRSPLRDSNFTNLDPFEVRSPSITTPRLKAQLMASDLNLRLKTTPMVGHPSSSATPSFANRYRSPMKPVKRLQTTSPHSPKGLVRSPGKNMVSYKPGRLSPMPNQKQLDLDV